MARTPGIPTTTGAHYLEHEEILVDRLRVFGSPWQPEYKSMAFNADDATRAQLFQQIPQGIDILVTHCPPAGVLDMNEKKQSCGCTHLGDNLDRIDPRLHVFGNIHKAAGTLERDNRTYVNAALAGSTLALTNPPSDC